MPAGPMRDDLGALTDKEGILRSALSPESKKSLNVSLTGFSIGRL